MKMGKRFVVLLLALALVLPFIIGAVPANAASGEVTRAEWISRVVETFDMTVDDTSTMPDNYYSDLTTDNPYYQDILLAVEFGLIDIEAGHPFRPGDPATREFAAHTLNFALGFQLDENSDYTFSESSSVTYPNDIQVAINRGWFSLSGGSFMPEQPITASEADNMLADAAQVLAENVIGDGSDNHIEFADWVVVIPQETNVVLDTASKAVTITGYTGSIVTGDTFVVFIDEMPHIYEAESVQDSGDGTITISTLDLTKEEALAAIVSMSYSGTEEADLADFEAAEDATFYVRDSSKGSNAPVQILSISPQSVDYDSNKKEVTATHQVKIDGVNIGSISILMSDVNISYNYELMTSEPYAMAVLTSNVEVSASLTFDLSSYAGVPKSIPIGGAKIGSIAGIELTVDFDLSGGLSATWEGELEAGVKVSLFSDNSLIDFQLIKSYHINSFSLIANVNISVGATIRAYIDIDVPMPFWTLDLLDGELGASAGGVLSVNIHATADGTVLNCVSQKGYLYLKLFYSINYDLIVTDGGKSKTYNIFDESNSPVRFAYHYENGQLVSHCTRGEETGIDPDYEYYTSPDSPYFNPAPGYGQSYEDGSGAVVQIYSYEVEEDDAGQEYAVITGYNGGASALAIPSEIDGYEVREIGKSAFYNDDNIRSVVIPSSVAEIGVQAFGGCDALSNVQLSSNLQRLNYSSFGNCPSLKEIHIPKSLTEVGTSYWTGSVNLQGGPFDGSGLTAVTFEDGTTSVLGGLFYDATSLQDVELLDSMTSIGGSAFRNCTSLETIEIPNSITSIGNSAFNMCESLKAINIPDSVTTIGAMAFQSCTDLSSVKLSNNLLELNYSSFGNCPSLKEIHIPKTLTEVGTSYWTGSVNLQGGPFDGSGLTAVTFEEGTTAVLDGLFYDAADLRDVELLDSMTSIGGSAFRNCTSLETIELPNSITSIGSNAFYMCESLASISIPDSVLSIGTFTFYGCESMVSIRLPQGIDSIGERTFTNCASLEYVDFPDSITIIGDYAFSGCTNLTSIELPDNLSKINTHAFDGDGLTSVIIPDACEIIESYAFTDNTKLAEVALSPSLQEIGAYCFENCDALTSITIPDSVSSLSTSVFNDCDLLAEVVLGNGITEIMRNTFSNCPALNNVVIPYGVTEIGSSAFANCTGLTSITIPRTVTSIETNAFSYKDRMTIYGVPGTYAETFANTNGFTFVPQENAATSVSLNVNELTINDNQEYQLTLTIEPPNFTDAIDWKSSNTDIVTVSQNGLIEGRSIGTATIKVTVGDQSASCKVTVVQPVTSISLNKTSLSLDALETYQLTATAKPSDAYNTKVIWSSSAPEIASVDENGLVTAHKKGTATITATADDGNGAKRNCTVTVSNNAHVAYSTAQLESSHPYEANCKDVWVLTAEGASYIEVTFDSKTYFEDDFDFVYVYGTGDEPDESNKYTGASLAGQTVRVYGDVIKIKLETDNGGNEWGFKVTDLKTDGKLDPYAEIRAELSSAAALDTDSAKLDAVRELDIDLLAEAMAAEESQIAGQLAELESGMSLTSDVIVTDSMRGHFTEDDIAVTGAVMNVQNTSSPVTLTIDAPHEADNYADSQYSSAVEFSMTLGNAIEPLEVPVMVTLPVPAGIEPDALVILHELSDGSVDRVEYTLSVEDGQTFASFVVTEFSDFTLAQVENDMFDAKLEGSTASVTVYGSSGSSIVCAVYDADGRMLSSDTRKLAASWQTLEFNVPSGAERVSFILLDSEYRPVMESIEP